MSGLGLSGVLARIDAIESRFSAQATPPVATAPTPGVDPEFEPFGEAYQRAVVQSASNRAAAMGVSAAPLDRATFVGRTTGLTSTSGVGTVGPLAAAGRRPVGGYGAMPVPEELTTFGNGRLPADQLVPISQPGHRLYRPAAAAWDSLVAEAAASGLELRITDSYRSYEEQVDLAHRKGLYRNGGLAAVPGTSNHGWGLAVDADVTDPAVREWLEVNGPRYGFVNAVPREPWHWEYRPHQV
jgi:hypothetical protein